MKQQIGRWLASWQATAAEAATLTAEAEYAPHVVTQAARTWHVFGVLMPKWMTR